MLIKGRASLPLTEQKSYSNSSQVFIAFMLGLHVSASYARFQQLLVELTGLFGAVKQICAELMTLGVPAGQRKMVERYS